MQGRDMLVTRRWQALCSANPRRLDRTQGVLPQARGECGTDLCNELVRMIEVVPADADDVPALGLEVALALALAGERGVDAACVLTVFGTPVELDADFFGRERTIDEVTTAPRVHLDLCARLSGPRHTARTAHALLPGRRIRHLRE